jgi:hypothetical protein
MRSNRAALADRSAEPDSDGCVIQGDPDLHAHIALANKVQTLDGRWLSIDGLKRCSWQQATLETRDAKT